MEISYLADHPECINQLASWFNEEWGDEDGGRTKEEWRSKLLQQLHTKNIPLTFVAFKNKKCVGTASLVFHELPSHTHLSPWLSCVYVAPEYRGNGIGVYLVKTVIRKAKELGFAKIYVYQYEPLAKKMEERYAFLGLNVIGKAKLNNSNVVIGEIDPNSFSSHLSGHESIKTL